MFGVRPEDLHNQINYTWKKQFDLFIEIIINISLPHWDTCLYKSALFFYAPYKSFIKTFFVMLNKISFLIFLDILQKCDMREHEGMK